MPAKGTKHTGAIFTVCMQEKHGNEGEKLYYAFVDLKNHLIRVIEVFLHFFFQNSDDTICVDAVLVFVCMRVFACVCEALGSCAHVAALERTSHGDLTTDMCIPAFSWTIDAVLEAIERYTELQESNSYIDCSE